MNANECGVVNFSVTRACEVSLYTFTRNERVPDHTRINMIQVSGKWKRPDKRNPTALCPRLCRMIA